MSEKNHALIGERLREERTRLGLSQTEVAERCDLTRRTLLSWEKGDQYPNASVLAEMSRLGFDVLYVVTGAHLWEAVPEDVGALMSSEEAILLADYRETDDVGKQTIRIVASALRNGITNQD